MRKASVTRDTAETQIALSLNLDGAGVFTGSSGVGFFDHMLCLLAKHGKLDLELTCQGDLEVDAHHTVEDVGLALGEALRRAAGDRRGIRRYGNCLLPMDETLARVALDLSGRPFLVYDAPGVVGMLGAMDAQLTEEFFRALANSGGITLHAAVLYGKNVHHQVEALFKGLGRALREALEDDPRESGIPSSKGVLA